MKSPISKTLKSYQIKTKIPVEKQCSGRGLAEACGNRIHQGP